MKLGAQKYEQHMNILSQIRGGEFAVEDLVCLARGAWLAGPRLWLGWLGVAGPGLCPLPSAWLAGGWPGLASATSA